MSEQKDITPYQQRIRDIVSVRGIREVSINQNLINKHNPYFTHEIKSASITDQQNSEDAGYSQIKCYSAGHC